MYNRFTIVFFSILIGNTALLLGQEEDPSTQDPNEELGTEVVNVVKAYTPTISDGFKIKENPSLGDDEIQVEEKVITYDIKSVPVASTYKPVKGKATPIPKKKKDKAYDSYALIEGGNFINVGVDFFTTKEINKNTRMHIDLTHDSSQGGIKDILFDDKYFDTKLGFGYDKDGRRLRWSMDADYHNQIYNWYGVPETLTTLVPNASDLEENQLYHSAHAGGSLTLSRSVFKGGNADVRYTIDNFSSSELRAILQPEFLVSIFDRDWTLLPEVDYISGSFDQNYFGGTGPQYDFAQVSLGQTFQIVDQERYGLEVGGVVTYNQDLEGDMSDFYIYPDVSAFFNIDGNRTVLYAEAGGGLLQNSYYDFVQNNPYVSPTLAVVPTHNQLDASLGLKGQLSPTVGYNLRGGYKMEEAKPLFQNNPTLLDQATQAYQLGNSFGVVYDDVDTINFLGEIETVLPINVNLKAQVQYNSYSLTNEEEAWNLPEIQGLLSGSYDSGDRFFGGIDFFYTGTREDRVVAIVDDLGNLGSATQTLDAFIDLNANINYRITDRFTAFIKGNNLLSQDKPRWTNFPVQGIQGLAGITYKFDVWD